MFGCYYEDMSNLPLFNTPYKIYMKGILQTKENDYIYLLYTHGKIFGLFSDSNIDKVKIYNNNELNLILENNYIRNCFKYEEELIIDKDTELFTSNLFWIEEVGNSPFCMRFFVVNNDIEMMVALNKTVEKSFLDQFFQKESLDSIIENAKDINRNIIKSKKTSKNIDDKQI